MLVCCKITGCPIFQCDFLYSSEILACGGINHQEEPQTCYMLVPSTGSDSEEWNVLTGMTHGRFGAASALTASGDVWVIGGMGPNWPNFDPLSSEIVGKIFYKNKVI